MATRKKQETPTNGTTKKGLPKKPIRARTQRTDTPRNGYSTSPYPVNRFGMEPCLVGSKIKPTELEWLWPEVIPRDFFSLVSGKVGAGKSTMFSALARAVTRGEAFGGGAARPPGRVIVFCPEEDIERTVQPRMAANGVDLDRIHFGDYGSDHKRLNRMVLPADLRLLGVLVADVGASLLIIDPITSYLSSGGDLRDELVIRALLDGLQTIATEQSCTILGTRGYRKSKEGDANDRVGGVAAWTQVPRHVLACGIDPEDESRRVLATSKFSLTDGPRSFRYEIKRVEKLPVFELGDECGVKADDFDSSPGNPGERDALADACSFLLDFLRSGPQPVNECNSLGLECGLSLGTLRRGKVKIGAISRQVSETTKPHWTWELPNQQAPA